MRTAFLVLLAANLAFFAWSQWLAPSASAAGAVAPNLPRVVLASEVPPSERRSARCLAVGPFLVPEEVSRAGRLLEEGGYQPSVRTTKGDVPSGFAVIVTGIDTAAKQQAAIARLRRAGFPEASAKLDTTDSLGVYAGTFPDLATAKARAAAAARTGVETGVAPQTRRGNVFWLEFTMKSDSSVTPEELQQTLGGGESGLRVEACAPAESSDGGPR